LAWGCCGIGVGVLLACGWTHPCQVGALPALRCRVGAAIVPGRVLARETEVLARQTEVTDVDMSGQVGRDFLGFGYKDGIGIGMLGPNPRHNG
jgi:hypothetical protein